MICGVLNIYKEKGYTSHDVVAKLRRITGQKKIGHTGTLDPDAVGVLPVCLGKATRLCGMLTDKDKEYETVFRLGITTDTQDMGGEILKQRPVAVSEEAVREAVASFVGSYEQLPPMYSALKVNGKKLYELAREGKTVERQKRPVTIHAIEIVKIDLPLVRMRVHCSKGTYIRTLCHDIGESLLCGAAMEELTRTRVERFFLEEALRLDEVEALMEKGRLGERVLPVDEMFSQTEKLTAPAAADKLLHCGNALPLSMLSGMKAPEHGQQVRLYDSGGAFVGIFACDEKAGRVSPVKMFYEGSV